MKLFRDRREHRVRPCPKAFAPEQDQADRYTGMQNDRADAGRCQQIPDRLASPQVDDLGRQKNILLLVLVQRQFWKVILAVPADEVKDAMPTGIGSRSRRWTTLRGLRGSCGGDAGKAPLLFQSGQVG